MKPPIQNYCYRNRARNASGVFQQINKIKRTDQISATVVPWNIIFWIFVTLVLSLGLPDPVFKNKKNTFSFNCSLSQKLHWKYESHWAVWAL